MGYVVIELTCAGIPEEKLEAEPFTADQENVLLQLDAGIHLQIQSEKCESIRLRYSNAVQDNLRERTQVLRGS